MKKLILIAVTSISLSTFGQSRKMIYFNSDDTPLNMGQSQLIESDSLQSFIKQRKEFLPEAKVVGNKLYFYTIDSIKHERYAIIIDVPSDFEN